MAAPNYMNMINEAGLDSVNGNSRVRATSTSGTNPLGTMYMQGTGTPITYTGTTQTMTAANLLTGMIIGQPSGSATYTTDTAANIIAAMNAASAGVQVGDYLECYLANDAAIAVVITIAGGTNVTPARATNLTLTGGQSCILTFRCTAVGATPTFTLYF